MANRNKDKYKNTVTYILKQELFFSKENELILDGQSKICNWLYNYLYEKVEEDYKNNNGENKLTNKYNLRNLVPELKNEYPFLKTVYSSVLKNVALRLSNAYEQFFKIDEIEHPHYRSWKKHWFSLEYEERSGWLIKDKNIIISLGKNENCKPKQLKVVGNLKEKLIVNENNIKAFRLIKNSKKFYGIFIVVEDKKPVKENDKWISLDPNHKNFFTSYDYKGESIEFQNLKEIRYWDEKIDEIKSKRDLRKRKSKFIKTYGNRGYWQPSKKWIKYNNALLKAEHRRREQIKSAMFTISNYLCKNYDKIMIGDYIPTNETTPYKNMKRSMLNQSHIGTFRRILKWTAEKSGKLFIKIDEKYTTMECCICGDMEKKDPNIRTFTCKKCGKTLSRDINSAINIAKKELNLSCTDYEGNLEKPLYIAYWRFNKSNFNMQIN